MALKLSGISRTFGDRVALNNVNFGVAPGKLTGFVGGNGAGKTTTMRIILGVLAPDSGEVTRRGATLSDAERRTFGYMPEERGLYPKMKVSEQLEYLARLHGLDRKAAARNAKYLIERLGLEERANDSLESLSLGNQQRAQVAAALVHEPSALILDEPFSGLDPMAVDVVVSVLNEQAARGIPVLFSSHQLDVVERLCDDLVIIAGGEIKAAGEREALRNQFTTPRYTLQAEADLGWVREVPGVLVEELVGRSVTFKVSLPDAAQEILRRAVASGPVIRFAPDKPSLAEIFREIIADAPAHEEKN